MTLIAFECERCGAGLKVRKMLAGRTIQCPKCGRKTAVPGPDTTPETPGTVESSETPGTAESPDSPVAVTPVTVDAAAHDRRNALLLQQVQILESQLADAAQTARAAQQESAGLREALNGCKESVSATSHDAVDGRLASELEATRRRMEAQEQRIGTLQEQLSQAQAAIASGSALPPSAVTFDDHAEAESLLAGMRSVSFPKILRTAVLIHAVIVLGTSIGYFYNMWRNRQPEPVQTEAEATAEPAVDALPAGNADASIEPPPSAAPASPAVPAVAPSRPKSEIERRIESLPEPGERPTASSVDLNF